jgi:hypothetical protein
MFFGQFIGEAISKIQTGSVSTFTSAGIGLGDPSR